MFSSVSMPPSFAGFSDPPSMPPSLPSLPPAAAGPPLPPALGPPHVPGHPVHLPGGGTATPYLVPLTFS